MADNTAFHISEVELNSLPSPACLRCSEDDSRAITATINEENGAPGSGSSHSDVTDGSSNKDACPGLCACAHNTSMTTSTAAPTAAGGKETNKLLYSIEETPPWYLCVMLGLQHYLTMVGATITLPFILTPLFCMQSDNPARAFILSTLFFVSGIVTLLQTTFGVRLPIVQGGTFTFLVPTIAILSTSFPPCDSLDIGNMTEAQQEEEWQMRMREVQGAIAVSAVFQVLLGFTGLIGLLVAFITPLVIAPTICLVGLAFFETAADKAATHWGIAFFTIALMVLFSQYLQGCAVPFSMYRQDGVGRRSWTTVRVKVFGLMPVLLSILLSWALCAILTASGALSDDSAARTDRAGQLLADSPWVRVPYPGQWGTPTVSAAGVFGMLAGVLASVVESVGDYYACARMSGATPPPHHAINRGIGIEGFGCFLAGVWGTGNGTTSISENIGAIGLTKVASRRVIQYGAAIMMIVGMLGKVSALFVSIPEPVVGGIFCVMFAMVTAVGLSALQHVDLNSSRNLFVLGFSIFFGLVVSKWLEYNPDAIQTGSSTVDRILTVLLQTATFVGGMLGALLDNTLPGTSKERGLEQWQQQVLPSVGDEGDCSSPSSVYDFPFGMEVIRRYKWTRLVPVCPTFRNWR